MSDCRFFCVPLMVRYLSRPTAQGRMRKKGSWGCRGLPLHRDKLMGENFKCLRWTSALLRLVHKDNHDMNISLQAQHTWVSTITFRSLHVPQKSRMRVRTSGIQLMGAAAFLQEQIYAVPNAQKINMITHVVEPEVCTCRNTSVSAPSTTEHKKP